MSVGKALFLSTLFFIFAGLSPLRAFGKNKVSYHDYQWQVLMTPHYRIYLAAPDLTLSNMISQTAEEIFRHHVKNFGYVPKIPIKVLIYPTQIDFQQNNIRPGLIGGGTGGFTEFIKGRVVLPYSIDPAVFHHILSHELTHAFQGLTWGKGNFRMRAIIDINIPLWAVEGMAEYNSIGLNREAEMMVSDALYHGDLPTLEQLSNPWQLPPMQRFFVYKEGQMFYSFLNERYGPTILSQINQGITKTRNFAKALSNATGLTPQRANDAFFDYLKQKYLARSVELDHPSLMTNIRRLIPKDSVFNMNPVAIDKNRVAFISGRMIYPSIVMWDKKRGRLRRLVKGGFDEEYLEFYYGKRNRLSVSTNGLLCFVSRSGGQDVIHLMTLSNGRTHGLKLPFRVIEAPDISKDGRRLLFSANKNHKQDIFLYDISGKKVTQLSDDTYVDAQPVFVDSDHIAFVSTRYRVYGSAKKDLLIMRLSDRVIETRIEGGEEIAYPDVSPDGSKIAFVSMGVHPTLMIYDRQSGKVYKEFEPDGGVMSPSFERDGRIVFSLLSDSRFNIYEYRPLYSQVATSIKVIQKAGPGAPIPSFKGKLDKVKTYRPEWSLDNLVGAFALNTALKGMALIGIADISELMGDQRIQIIMDSTIQTQTNFLDYVNADWSYVNLKHRWNFGFRLFSFANSFYEFNTFHTFTLNERPYHWSGGVMGVLSYPFTTFARVDFRAGVRGYKYIDSISQIGTNYIYNYSYQNRDILKASFVYDDTLWDVTGPIDGVRMSASIEAGFPILKNAIEYQRLLLDYRHYLMIVPHYSLAFRVVLGKSFGPDRMKYPFNVGGFNSIRGYELFAYSGDSLFLFNAEFRFPLIVNWTIGVPFIIHMPTIWGVVFWDMGSAWQWDQGYTLSTGSGPDWRMKDLKAGLGFGLRLVLIPGIKLMMDLATPYDGGQLAPLSQWKSFWQIGVDF